MSKPLQGKTALVTGGASGIGLATVEMLAGQGARVAMNHLAGDDRGAAEIARLKAQGLDVIAAIGSVADGAAAEAMVAKAVGELGRLDYLVNNAGTSATKEPIPPAALDRLSDDFWNAILSTNLLGPFHCTRAAAPALRQARGAVVNTASVAGLDEVGSSLAYGASKAALINMTKNLARALAPEVRVNAVAPGFVDSPWTADWPQEKKDWFAGRALLRRACLPRDIAEVICFLCSGTAMTTGQTLVVDGGMTLA